MKVFSKFLAVILALVTVLTLIPFSVFAKEASDPWLEVEGNEGTDAPVVTIKVDAAGLMALLSVGDSSLPTLSELRSGITFDLATLTNVFSVQELFEIIPQSALLEIVSVEDIVKQLGMEKLESYVDKAELIKSVSKEDLIALLEDVDDLTVIVDVQEALKTIDKDLLLKYMDEDAVFAEVDVWDAVEMIFNDPAFNVADLKSIVKVNALVSGTALKWEELIDLSILTDDASITDIVTQYVTVDGSDLLKVEALLGESIENYIDIIDYGTGAYKVKVDKVVQKVGIPGLMASDIVTVDLDGIMGNATVSDYVFANMDISAVLPEVKDALKPLSATELESYVNKTAAFDLIDLNEAIELLGGFDKAQKFVDVAALLADPAMDVEALVPYVQMDKLVETVGLSRLMNLVPASALMAQLDTTELYQLLLSINIRPYATKLFALILRKTLSNVDELTIDGQLVASEDDKQMLQIHSAALVNVLKTIRPTLTDIANAEDGKILSTPISFKYTVDGTEEQKSKEMILEVVLEGDIATEQAMAKKISTFIQKYASYSFMDGTLTVDVKVPAAFARLFNRVLNSQNLAPETKERLLNLVNRDGEDLMGVLEKVTTTDIVNMIKAVDLEKVSEIALQYAYVQRCLEIASKYSGVDMSNMDIEALLDYSVKVPGLKRISNIIKNRYGVDVYAALEKYETTDELYNAALNKAEASVNAFERATDFVIRMIDTYIPENAKNLSLMDGYNGNGNFTLNKTVTMNTKSVAVKALNRLVKWSGLNINTEAFEVLLSQVSEGTETVKLDFSLQVADVYSITYKNKNTNETLFTAFLPVGADLSVFQNKDATGGIEITEWVDEDGNPITTMPARDLVVYTGAQGEEPREEVTVTFLNQNKETLGSVTVFSGDTLKEHIATVDGFEALIDLQHVNVQFLYDRFEVAWRVYNSETGEIGSRWMPTRTAVTKNITVIAEIVPDYFIDIEDVDYEVQLSENGNTKNFTVKIHEELPEAFVMDLDSDHLLQLAKMSYDVNLDVIVGEKQYCFFRMDDAFLAALKAVAPSKQAVTFHFGTTSENAPNTLYAKDESASFFTFEIQIGGAAYDKNFVKELEITLPYALALNGAADASCATRIHLIYADGTRELVERIGSEEGFVTFKAPHFSEYVVSNEYKMNLGFVSTQADDPTAIFGTWRGEDAIDTYFPAGCEIKAIPVISAENVNNYTWVSTVYKIGEKTGNLAYGEIFVMPAEAVDVTVTVHPRECSVYYYVLGEQFYKDTYFFYQQMSMRPLDDPAVMAKDPDGTPSAYKWVGFDSALIGVCDIYAYAKWNDAVYYIEFLGRDGKPVSTLSFDECNFYTIKAPAIPVEIGYVGAWEKYDLTSAFGKADGYTIKVKAIYTEAIFKIFSDGIVTVVASAKFGDTVKVTAPDKVGYDKIILVTLANNTTQTVEDGVFVMPESEVYVDVTYIPHSYNYTINGFEYQGKMNETVAFDITLPRGKVLETVPAGCVLAGAKLNADGSLVLTYSFELLEDGMSVNWKWEDSKYNMLQIINGKLFDGNGVPVSTNDDAVFLGWSPAVADNLQFAIFGIYEEPASWLWLWILLILLVLIGLIVLFYLLYKAGKIGLNAFTRVILWIVNLFFTVCIAIAEFGMKIAGLFGKGKSNEEYGIAEKAEDAKKED